MDKNKIDKFKSTVEKFQDILDYYIQTEIFTKRINSKWFIDNKFIFNKDILIKCFKTDNFYELWKTFREGKLQFLSLMFLLRDSTNSYPLTIGTIENLLIKSRCTFDDIIPIITIGYLPGTLIELFSVKESNYLWDTLSFLEKTKKENIFEYYNLPWKSSRIISKLRHLIELKLHELSN